MTPVRFTALAAISFALISSAATASTGGREVAAAPQQGRSTTANAYVRDVEARMRAARGRIEEALKKRQMARGALKQMLGDVDAGIGAIRKRVAGYATDGAITAAEDSDVKALASAIAMDLANHYGAIAPWYLLP